MPHLHNNGLSSFSRSTPPVRHRQLKKKPHQGSAEFFRARDGRFRPLSRNLRQGCGHACTKNAEGLIHNAENQITTYDGSTATYKCDGEGRRVKKTANGVTTFTFYGLGGIISEFSLTGSATAASTADSASYSTSDKLGTAVLLMATNGTVRENNRTLPYGELWNAAPASMSSTKFTTYERDSESNLDYAMHRYYGNGGGRFNSVDEGAANVAHPISLNRYRYVVADPVNGLDRTGRNIEWDE